MVALRYEWKSEGRLGSEHPPLLMSRNLLKTHAAQKSKNAELGGSVYAACTWGAEIIATQRFTGKRYRMVYNTAG
jgi:hypothetical protein